MDGIGIERGNRPRAGKSFRPRPKKKIKNKFFFKNYMSNEAQMARATKRRNREPRNYPDQKVEEE